MIMKEPAVSVHEVSMQEWAMLAFHAERAPQRVRVTVKTAEAAAADFHARLAAARDDLDHPNPSVRRGAAWTIRELTCNYVAMPRFPDDHLWLGNWQAKHTPELDKYMKRCRRLWREQVVNAKA